MYLTQLIVCGLLAQLPPPPHVPSAPNAAPGSAAPASVPTSAPPGAAIAEPEPPPFVDPTPPPSGRERGGEMRAGGGRPHAAPPASSPGSNPPETPPPPVPPRSDAVAPAAGQSSAHAPRATGAPVVAIEPHTMKLSAAEALHDALRVPESEKINGRPITLVDVLRVVADRAAQFRATELYWKVSEALAEYNFSWDEYQQFERLKPAAAPDKKPSQDEQLIVTRLAAAKARVQDAELALVSAQYELAGAIHVPAGQPLPLPADMPHVGAYRTELDRLYAGRPVPPRAVLIDRTLPIRRSAIDARATAVQAATDALEAAEEAFFEGHGSLSLVVSLLDERALQRRALMADVRIYNNEIAEYAMSAPTPALDPQSLASMLIKPVARGPQGAIAGGAMAPAGAAGNVERAGFNQPVDNRPAGPLQPVPEGQIPLAPPPGFPATAPQREPTLAPARPPQTMPGRQPTAAPPRSAPAEPSAAPLPAAPAPTAPGGEAPPFNARKPVFNHEDQGGSSALPTIAAGASLYPALQAMNGEQQARQLAHVLCWEPAPASATLSPVVLEDYLTAVSSVRRNEALAVYWQAVHQAARAQVLSQQLEQYATLGAALAAAAAEPGPTRASERADAMLLVRAGQAATEADARRAEVDRMIAQWSLTLAGGRSVTGPWLVAETLPHAGGYRLQLDELPRELLDSTLVRQLIALIPQLRRSLVDRAAAVVAADKARGDFTLSPGEELTATDRAIAAIRAQGAETMTFLARLTEYNIEIAAYANAVLPPATSGQSLARVLVVAPGAAGAR